MNAPLFLSALACLFLSACNPTMQEAMQTGVRSGAALEAYASKVSFGMRKSQDAVAAPPAVVRKRLATYAAQCVNNRVKAMTITRVNAGIPGSSTLAIGYQARITNEDGTPRLIVAQAHGGDVINISPGTRGYNVALSSKILSDGKGGTILSTVRSSTYYALYDDVLAWARGQMTTCPKL